MWVGHEFPGDDNETLKLVQHGLYGEMVARLFCAARDRYLAACRLTGAETELGARALAMRDFDHRTLQDSHDRIAAWHRFRDDGGQLRLGESGREYEERLACQWREFFRIEVGSLAELDEFIRDILSATVFGNSERGYAAESGLRELLGGRYAAMYQARARARGLVAGS